MLGWLTGNGDTAKQVVGSVIDAGDALFYTDEEKAKNYASYREWYLKYLEATQPQNISRRMIAVVVVMLWALLIITSVIAEAFHVSHLSEFIFKTMKENVNTPFITVLGFYFLKHVISNKK